MFPKIGVPPKSSILIGFSIINHPFWDTIIFGNTHLDICSLPETRISHELVKIGPFLFWEGILANKLVRGKPKFRQSITGSHPQASPPTFPLQTWGLFKESRWQVVQKGKVQESLRFHGSLGPRWWQLNYLFSLAK